MKLLGAITRFLASMRLGYGLLVMIGLWGALGSLPAGGLMGTPAGLPIWASSGLQMTEGEWYAAWPFVGLLLLLVVNMLASTARRIAVGWMSLGVLLAHWGVAILAIGAAYYATHKIEGHVVLLAADPAAGGAEGPDSVLFADKTGVSLAIERADGGPTVDIPLPLGRGGLPRRPSDGQQRVSIALPETADARVRGMDLDVVIEWSGADERDSAPGSPFRSAALIVEGRGPGSGAGLRARVPFGDLGTGPTVVRLGDGVDLQMRFQPRQRRLPAAISLRSFEMIPFNRRADPAADGGGAGRQWGGEVPRDFVSEVVVRHADGSVSVETISLNRPLTLPMAHEGWLAELMGGRWKLSQAGWDSSTWIATRQLVRAGLLDRPRVRHNTLAVGNDPGVRLIALGGWMIGVGLVWSALIRPIFERWSRRASPAGLGAIAACFTVIVLAAAPARAGLPADYRWIGMAAEAADRAAPVLHNGRLAPIETMASETLRSLGWSDVPASLSAELGTGSASATLLTITLARDDALGWPIIAVEDPGARRLLGIQGSGISPTDLRMRLPGAAAASTEASVRTRAALGVLEARLDIVGSLHDRWAMIHAADAADRQPRWFTWWDSDLPERPRAAWAAVERALDSRHGVALAEALREAFALASAVGPRSVALRDLRLNVECRLGPAPLFSAAAWTLLAGAAMLLLAGRSRDGTPRQGLMARLGWLVLAVGTTLAVGGFGLRWLIAGRLPIQNQFESMIGLSVAAAAVGVLAGLRRGRPRFGAAGGFVAAVALLAGAHLPIPGRPIEPEAGILATSGLLQYHVGTLLVSHAMSALAGVSSAAWVVARAWGASRDRLETLDRATARLGSLVCCTLGVGILLGAWWADHAWGRWWAFDPKETWALITWLVYLAMVHHRATRGSRASPAATALLGLLGLAVMLWSYFGVNLLLNSLHAYA
ncbi:MAG: cytochrome c biogenesis protein CcsA [Phycisphaerales bacterium]|nr:cytochrome c biogenesis protein CcsA [Phycisphaerales bacterium]